MWRILRDQAVGPPLKKKKMRRNQCHPQSDYLGMIDLGNDKMLYEVLHPETHFFTVIIRHNYSEIKVG